MKQVSAYKLSVSFPHAVFPALTSYVDGLEGDEDKHEPRPVLNFAEAHTAFQTVKSFFYAHNVGEHDENILNMERAKQLSKFFCGENQVPRDIKTSLFDLLFSET
jgi:hypothetical protein